MRFTGEPDAVRAWIRNFANRYVTSAATQPQQSEVFKARQKAVAERKLRRLRLERLQDELEELEQESAGVGGAALADHLDVPPDLAGALAVGRFKDGTPVTLQRMAGLRDVYNFEYEEVDGKGFRCPAHAHIRKVNPRGTTPHNPLESEPKALEEERRHRIARRGIPYGEQEDVGANPVGLLFMCYQSDIKEQFEFIQRSWADNPNFPKLAVIAHTGDDPIIGQDTDQNAEQQWPKHWGESGRASFNFGSYVTLRGGE